MTTTVKTLTHGVRPGVRAELRQLPPYGYGLVQEVSHDLAVPVSGVSSATLYSDANCTTPLTAQAITIPSGRTRAVYVP